MPVGNNQSSISPIDLPPQAGQFAHLNTGQNSNKGHLSNMLSGDMSARQFNYGFLQKDQLTARNNGHNMMNDMSDDLLNLRLDKQKSDYQVSQNPSTTQLLSERL